MGFVFIDWALGHALGKGADRLLDQKETLIKRLDDVITSWAKGLSAGEYVHENVFFQGINCSADCKDLPRLTEVVESLSHLLLPTEQQWFEAFCEQWQHIRQIVEEPQPFFQLPQEQAAEHLHRLASRVFKECLADAAIFRIDTHKRLRRIEAKIDALPPQPIRETSTTGQVHGAVPSLPEQLISRSEYLEPLKAMLLGGTTTAIGITVQAPAKVGLQGMGGIGKTILAAALTEDEQLLLRNDIAPLAGR